MKKKQAYVYVMGSVFVGVLGTSAPQVAWGLDVFSTYLEAVQRGQVSEGGAVLTTHFQRVYQADLTKINLTEKSRALSVIAPVLTSEASDIGRHERAQKFQVYRAKLFLELAKKPNNLEEIKATQNLLVQVLDQFGQQLSSAMRVLATGTGSQSRTLWDKVRVAIGDGSTSGVDPDNPSYKTYEASISKIKEVQGKKISDLELKTLQEAARWELKLALTYADFYKDHFVTADSKSLDLARNGIKKYQTLLNGLAPSDFATELKIEIVDHQTRLIMQAQQKVDERLGKLSKMDSDTIYETERDEKVKLQQESTRYAADLKSLEGQKTHLKLSLDSKGTAVDGPSLGAKKSSFQGLGEKTSSFFFRRQPVKEPRLGDVSTRNPMSEIPMDPKNGEKQIPLGQEGVRAKFLNAIRQGVRLRKVEPKP